MAEYSPRPKTADVLTLCASARMIGAQAIFPVIGHVFGLFLFYGGLAVATFYLLWRWGLHYIGRAVTRSGREPVWKAVMHVAAVLHDTESNESYPAARTAIRQAALDGHLHVYGHKSDQPMGERWQLQHSKYPYSASLLGESGPKSDQYQRGICQPL